MLYPVVEISSQKLFYNCKSALQNPFVYQQNQGFYTTYTYEENIVIYRASATQNGLYCYAYCRNNPLKYTDPSGDFIAFTDFGYDFWKYVSPIAIKVNINWTSEDQTIGLDVSVGMPQISPFHARAQVGASYHFDYYNKSGGSSSYKGWEGRYGGEVGVTGFKIGFTYYDFEGSKFDQMTGSFTIGNPLFNVKYENDWFFGLPIADNGDRYRTAAVRVRYAWAELGLNLYTGDPGLNEENRFHPQINGQETYKPNIYGNNPDEYRAGILYFGLGPLRIGRNSEKIRDKTQNQIIHKRVTGSPFFRIIDDPNESGYNKPDWYWGFGTGTGNSLW